MEAVYEGNKAIYKNAWSNATALLSADETGVRHDIFVQNGDKTSFEYLVEAKNLTLKTQEDGQVVFVDSEGNEKFQITKPTQVVAPVVAQIVEPVVDFVQIVMGWNQGPMANDAMTDDQLPVVDAPTYAESSAEATDSLEATAGVDVPTAVDEPVSAFDSAQATTDVDQQADDDLPNLPVAETETQTETVVDAPTYAESSAEATDSLEATAGVDAPTAVDESASAFDSAQATTDVDAPAAVDSPVAQTETDTQTVTDVSVTGPVGGTGDLSDAEVYEAFEAILSGEVPLIEEIAPSEPEVPASEPFAFLNWFMQDAKAQESVVAPMVEPVVAPVVAPIVDELPRIPTDEETTIELLPVVETTGDDLPSIPTLDEINFTLEPIEGPVVDPVAETETDTLPTGRQAETAEDDPYSTASLLDAVGEFLEEPVVAPVVEQIVEPVVDSTVAPTETQTETTDGAGLSSGSEVLGADFGTTAQPVLPQQTDGTMTKEEFMNSELTEYSVTDEEGNTLNWYKISITFQPDENTVYPLVIENRLELVTRPLHNYAGENFAFAEDVTLMKDTGAKVEFTLAEGVWKENEHIQKGCHVIGGGGEASIIETTLKSPVIRAQVLDDFSAEAIKSGNWEVQCVEKEDGYYQLSSDPAIRGKLLPVYPLGEIYTLIGDEQLDPEQNWKFLDKITVQEETKEQEVYYAISFDEGKTFVVWDGAVNEWREVVRVTDGLFEYKLVGDLMGDQVGDLIGDPVGDPVAQTETQPVEGPIVGPVVDESVAQTETQPVEGPIVGPVVDESVAQTETDTETAEWNACANAQNCLSLAFENEANRMTKADVEALTSAELNAENGYVPGSESVTLGVGLRTNDINVTPRFQKAEFGYLEDAVAPVIGVATDEGDEVENTELTFTVSADDETAIKACYADVQRGKNDPRTDILREQEFQPDIFKFTGETGNTYYFRYMCEDIYGNRSEWSDWTDGISILEPVGELIEDPVAETETDTETDNGLPSIPAAQTETDTQTVTDVPVAGTVGGTDDNLPNIPTNDDLPSIPPPVDDGLPSMPTDEEITEQLIEQAWEDEPVVEQIVEPVVEQIVDETLDELSQIDFETLARMPEFQDRIKQMLGLKNVSNEEVYEVMVREHNRIILESPEVDFAKTREGISGFFQGIALWFTRSNELPEEGKLEPDLATLLVDIANDRQAKADFSTDFKDGFLFTADNKQIQFTPLFIENSGITGNTDNGYLKYESDNISVNYKFDSSLKQLKEAITVTKPYAPMTNDAMTNDAMTNDQVPMTNDTMADDQLPVADLLLPIANPIADPVAETETQTETFVDSATESAGNPFEELINSIIPETSADETDVMTDDAMTNDTITGGQIPNSNGTEVDRPRILTAEEIAEQMPANNEVADTEVVDMVDTEIPVAQTQTDTETVKDVSVTGTVSATVEDQNAPAYVQVYDDGTVDYVFKWQVGDSENPVMLEAGELGTVAIKSGEDIIATIPAPYYVDNENVTHTGNIAWSIEEGGVLALTLKNPDPLKFPIVIDPTVDASGDGVTEQESTEIQSVLANNGHLLVQTLGKNGALPEDALLAFGEGTVLTKQITRDGNLDTFTSTLDTDTAEASSVFEAEANADKVTTNFVNDSTSVQTNFSVTQKDVTEEFTVNMLGDAEYTQSVYRHANGDTKVYFNDNDILTYTQTGTTGVELKEWIYARQPNTIEDPIEGPIVDPIEDPMADPLAITNTTTEPVAYSSYAWQFNPKDTAKQIILEQNEDGSVNIYSSVISNEINWGGMNIDEMGLTEEEKAQTIADFNSALNKDAEKTLIGRLETPWYITADNEKKAASYEVVGNIVKLKITEPAENYPLVIDPTYSFLPSYKKEVFQVEAGYYHNLVIKDDGTVWAFGDDAYGQLGDGTSGTDSNTPGQVLGVGGTGTTLEGIVKVAGGIYHSLALKNDGTVYAWGRNNYGQLGQNSSDSSTHPLPLQVVGEANVGYLEGVVDIAAGAYHSLALKGDGTVYAWGYNGLGQIGDNSTTQRNTPVQVNSVGGTSVLDNIISLSAGYYHSLALESDGNVYAWGYNADGQLGNNSTSTNRIPIGVCATSSSSGVCDTYLTGITKLAAGQYHSLALLSNGTVWAWGRNDEGEIGDNTEDTDRLVAVQVQDGEQTTSSGYLEGIIDISAGYYGSSAVANNGIVFGWGDNSYGRLGDGTVTQRNTPVKVKNNVTNIGLANIISIRTGYYHSIAVDATGKMFTWGYNSNSQLGIGNTTGYYSPVMPIPLNKTMIAGSYYHSIVLKDDGTVWAWGGNSEGELGDNNNPTDSYTPVQVLGVGGSGYLTGVVAIAAGQNFSLALKNNGTVFAWGRNAEGQIGINNTTTPQPTPVQVLGVGGSGYLTGVVAIAAGRYYSMALKYDGTVFAWGSNVNGEIGINNTTTPQTTPVQVLGVGASGYLTDIKEIATGGTHSMALRNDGMVYAWGRNTEGQIGINNVTTPQTTPVQVLGVGASGYLTGVVAIDGGGYHSMALKSDGTVFAWGQNTYGAIGINNVTTPQTTPVQVLGLGGSGYLTGIKAIAGGWYHSMALKSDGTVWTWGYNLYGQIGIDNVTTPQTTPVQVLGVGASGYLTGVVAIAKGVFFHSMALKSDGRIFTWGRNNSGELGDGTVTQRNTPVMTIGLTGTPISTTMGSTNRDVVSTSCGAYSCYAVKSDGRVYSWGQNTNYGSLGDGTTTTRTTPVHVIGPDGEGYLEDIVKVAGGRDGAIALTRDGNVYSWGRNTNGELGINTTSMGSSTPQHVLSGESGAGTYMEGIVDIAAGNYFFMVLKNDGKVYTWGDNPYGQLGDSTEDTDRLTAVGVDAYTGAALTDVVSISAGYYHSLAVKKDGTVLAWGYNNNGQIGDASVTQRLFAVRVQDGAQGTTSGYMERIVKVAGGQYHSIALESDGRVWAWGDDDYGQVGDGTTTAYESTPKASLVNITGVQLDTAVDIAAGYFQSYAVDASGELWVWGNDTYGQLAQGSTSSNSAIAIKAENVGSSGSLRRIISISSNYYSQVALNTEGRLFTWGRNAEGELGNGTTTAANVPVMPIPLPNSKPVIKAGGGVTALLKSDGDGGTVWNWGYNAFGQLGDNTTTQRNTPVQVCATVDAGAKCVTYLEGIVAISVGRNGIGGTPGNNYYTHTLALKNDGTVWAWGYNSDGQLGDNSTSTRYLPVQVLGVGGSGYLTNIVAVEAGGYHSLALSTDGTVYAWGNNAYGELGNNNLTAGTDSYTPVQVCATSSTPGTCATNLTGITSISAGRMHNLALEGDTTVSAWGYNGNGQLGTANTTNYGLPQNVQNVGGGGSLSGVDIILGMGYTSMGIIGGWVGGWGYNGQGQIGDGSTTQRTTPVNSLSGESGATTYMQNMVSIAGGNYHTVAIRSDGSVFAWGYNNPYGQVGMGSTSANQTSAKAVLGVGGIGYLDSVTSVAGGAFHSAAVKTDGTVFGWGRGNWGQLGNDDTATYSAPVTTIINNPLPILDDLNPPTVTTTTHDGDAYVTLTDTVNITSDGADAEGALASCYAYWDSDTDWDSLDNETSLDNLGADCDGAVTVPDSTDGTWYFCVRPMDGMGYTNYNCTTAVTYDESAPTCSISGISEDSSTSCQYVTGSTVYYNNNASCSSGTGMHTVTVSASDGGSGIQKVNFPTTVYAGGDDMSSAYTWQYTYDTGDTYNTSATATCYNNVDLTATANFYVYRDIATPTGGALTYTDDYQTTTGITVNYAAISDAGSGVATYVTQSRSATLSNGSCGTYGSWGNTPNQPSGTGAGSISFTATDGNCYQFQYILTDNVSNQATQNPGYTTKVDATAPAAPTSPSIVPTGYQNSTSYTIDWTNPADASGFSGGSAAYYYKIGMPPTGPGQGTLLNKGTATSLSGLSQGANTVLIWLQDAAGNEGYASGTSVTAYYDTALPTVTVTSLAGDTGAPYYDTVNDSATNLVLSVSDTGGSGVAGCKWSATNVAYASMANSCTGTTTSTCSFGSLSEGPVTRYYACADVAGNISTPNPASIAFNVDWTPPTVTSTTENDADNYVTNATSVTITSDGTDSGSGVNNCYAYWDSNTAYAGTETSLGDLGTDCDGAVTVPNSTDGTWYFCIRPVDNVSLNDYDCTSAVTYDESAPSISSITSVAGDTGAPYYDTTDNSSTAIVFVSTDGTGVGVSNCAWSATDVAYASMTSCSSTTTCTANLSGNGAKTVYIRCIDTLGYPMLSSTTVNYTIDSGTPDIVAVDAGPSSGDRTSWTSATWYDYAATGSDDLVSFSWTDPSSASDDTFYYEMSAGTADVITGVESSVTTPYVDSITVTEGTNYFHVRPRNGALTWGTERYFTVRYDKTGPTGSISNASGNPTSDDTPTLNLTIADAGVGTTGAQMQFSCDNSTWTTLEAYATPKTNFDINSGSYGCTAADGSKTVYVRYQDSLGNTGTSYNTGAFTLDTTAPAVTSVTEDDADNYVTNGNTVNLDGTVTEGGSGIATCIAYWDSNTAYAGTETSLGDLGTDCDGAVTVPNSTDGTWYFCIRPVDNVSLNDYDCTSAVTYDESAPSISSITSVAGDTGAPYYDTTDNSSTAIVFVSTDGTGVGVSNCAWSATDVAYASMTSCSSTTTCTANLSGNGAKTVYIRCIDTLGYPMLSSTTVNYTIDSGTPDIVAVDAGPSSGDRTSWTSATWYDYADTGSDDAVSFSWTDPASSSDDTFYYEMSSGTANVITGVESSVTTAYVDSISVTEGTNYFHVRPRNGALTWGTERYFTVRYDKTGPTGTSITYSGASRILDGSDSITINSVSDGTDSLSGIDTGTRILQRQSATYANNTCGSYGSWGSVSYGGTYSGPLTDSTVTSGNCYKYRWCVSDNAGNQTCSTETSAITVITFNTVAITGGNNQNYGDSTHNPIGHTLGTALQVRVSDGGTNYAQASEITVNYSISSVPASPTATGQNLGGSSDATDASGYAEQTLTLGDRAGVYQVQATCSGCNTVTFSETENNYFDLSIVETDLYLDMTPGSSPSDSASPTINVTTNAASYQVHATPDDWPTYLTHIIQNWTGSLGFGWNLASGSTTAFSESSGDPAATQVYSCSGDTCQGLVSPDVDFDMTINYSHTAGSYTNTVELSGQSISY